MGEVRQVTTNDDARIIRVERPTGQRDVTIYSPAALNVIGSTPQIPEINPEARLADICAAQMDEIRLLREDLMRQRTINGTLAKAATALTREIQRRDQTDEVRIK